ncbi:MAG: 4Fe-4S binding protein [Desulfobacteraceae bacterium]|jgi:dissimilatory sulfite reductase (desulfoviridin) alpha/beta subunit|nr:4Fe-4S binding protein [Desulfobacteraceae bacterium]
MKWTEEAEAAIGKVPFFVRKKVRARVEKEAAAAGRKVVTFEAVQETQRRYLSGMKSEIRGYQIDSCFGPSGCPNRAAVGDRLLSRIEEQLRAADLLTFLRDRVGDDLKFHHEFRVSLADCPNACSQPQIKDIGILGACVPNVTGAECSDCGLCVEACRDGAIGMEGERPSFDVCRCMACGKCADVCPTGTLMRGATGYRVQLGGKLGRHPRLARPLPGIYAEDTVLSIVGDCITFYKKNSRKGERFAEICTDAFIESMARRYRGKALAGFHGEPPRQVGGGQER